jgi:hypothetical protein
MTINIPDGMDITPEDMERGEIEVLAAFSIGEDGTKLTLKTIDGMPIEEEMEEEEEDMEEAEEGEMEEMPTEEETIGDFVRGQLASQGMGG